MNAFATLMIYLWIFAILFGIASVIMRLVDGKWLE